MTAMNHAAEPEVLAGLSIFEKTCGYCGARFRVLASRSAGASRPQAYDCPGCAKQYEVEAAAPPEVHMLRGRTDGKDDRYQETMF
jgi:transposase-like protein